MATGTGERGLDKSWCRDRDAELRGGEARPGFWQPPGHVAAFTSSRVLGIHRHPRSFVVVRLCVAYTVK
jgi:hypothetical protein